MKRRDAKETRPAQVKLIETTCAHLSAIAEGGRHEGSPARKLVHRPYPVPAQRTMGTDTEEVEDGAEAPSRNVDGPVSVGGG